MRKYENYERKRNKYVGFRLSPEEKQRLDTYVKMSGMTFRDYVAKRALQEDVVVVGNTKVYKALKIQMEGIVNQLCRIKRSDEVDDEFLRIINFALKIYEGLKDNQQDNHP